MFWTYYTDYYQEVRRHVVKNVLNFKYDLIGGATPIIVGLVLFFGFGLDGWESILGGVITIFVIVVVVLCCAMFWGKLGSENFFLDDVQIRRQAPDKFVGTEIPHGPVTANHNSRLSSPDKKHFRNRWKRLGGD
jgi:hypothetical protein